MNAPYKNSFPALTLLLACGVVGCANRALLAELRQKGASDLDCPVGVLSERKISNKGWVVSGCGSSATYLLLGSPKHRYWERDYTETGRVPKRSKPTPLAMPPPTPARPAVGLQEDGLLSLNLRLRGANLVVQLRGQPSRDAETVSWALYKKAPPQTLQSCELKMLVDGTLLDLPPPQYESKAFSELLSVKLPFASLVALSSGHRVLGQVCETRFELEDAELASVRKFVLRWKEEVTLAGAGVTK